MKPMLLRRFVLLLSALLLACAFAPTQAAPCEMPIVAAVSTPAAADPAAQIDATLFADASADATDDVLVDTGTSRLLPPAAPAQAPALRARAPIQPCPERLERPPR